MVWQWLSTSQCEDTESCERLSHIPHYNGWNFGVPLKACGHYCTRIPVPLTACITGSLKSTNTPQYILDLTWVTDPIVLLSLACFFTATEIHTNSNGDKQNLCVYPRQGIQHCSNTLHHFHDLRLSSKAPGAAIYYTPHFKLYHLWKMWLCGLYSTITLPLCP